MNLVFENSFTVMPTHCNYMFPMIFGGAFFSEIDLCAACCVNRLLHDSECDSAVTHKVIGLITKYRKNLKQKLMNYKGGKCEICGYDKPIPCVYDFHHKNKSEKSYSISTNLCKSYADLIKEVDKCLLLCKNCHYEKHHNENWA